MCRLHKPKSGMPKGPFPSTQDRSIGRCNSWTRPNKFSGRIPRVSSDCLISRGSQKDRLHHSTGNILLQGNAIRSKERWHHISTNGHQNVQRPNREDNGDLHRRYGCKKQVVSKPLERFDGNILDTETT